MNKPIDRLFARALDQAVSETWTTLTSEQLARLRDKFAELIVRECVKFCEHESNDDDHDEYDMGMWVKAESIKTAIKEHFGVEE